MEVASWRNERTPPTKRADIKAWSVEVQGLRIQVKCKTAKPPKTKGRKRGVITEFSRRARGRKLRRIASVNWKETLPVQFLTLTYPDQVANHTLEERKVHRFFINRWICTKIGRPLACFWRVEWMPRKTGIYVGKMMPHMHLLYLQTPRICEMQIRLKWMQILGVRQYVQVAIRDIAIADVVSLYTAKYCAKETSQQILDNVPYRIRTGRHAGELRSRLIPMHEKETTERIDQAILSFLQGEACKTLWWFDPRFDEGFTIIGEKALAVIASFHGMRLDLYGEEA